MNVGYYKNIIALHCTKSRRNPSDNQSHRRHDAFANLCDWVTNCNLLTNCIAMVLWMVALYSYLLFTKHFGSYFADHLSNLKKDNCDNPECTRLQQIRYINLFKLQFQTDCNSQHAINLTWTWNLEKLCRLQMFMVSICFNLGMCE